MKIAVLTPYFGGIDFSHLQCMRNFASLDTDPDEMYFVQRSNEPWLDIVFATLAETALEANADVLFWIEHDMIFEAKDALEMSRRLATSDFDVLGACYSQRVPGGRVVGGIRGDKITFFEPGLFEADSVGLGFTAVKRSVFEKMAETLPNVYCPAVSRKIHPYFAHEISEGYFGQDASFFRRCRKLGVKIGIDAEPRVYHRGQYNYGLEDAGITVPRYKTLIANHNKESENQG